MTVATRSTTTRNKKKLPARSPANEFARSVIDKRSGASNRRLTPFQVRLLQTIDKLGDNAYGLLIFEAMSEATSEAENLAQIYVTLKRQVHRKYLEVRDGESPVPGHRAVKLYKVTAEGHAAVKRALNR